MSPTFRNGPYTDARRRRHALRWLYDHDHGLVDELLEALEGPVSGDGAWETPDGRSTLAVCEVEALRSSTVTFGLNDDSDPVVERELALVGKVAARYCV